MLAIHLAMSSLRRNDMSGLGGESNVALTRLARPSINRNVAIRSLSEAKRTSREHPKSVVTDPERTFEHGIGGRVFRRVIIFRVQTVGSGCDTF
jgi:hypothetical protein